MDLSVASILKAVQTGLSYVQAVSPIAAAIGGPLVAKVLNVVQTTTEIATDLKGSVDVQKVILKSEDKAELDRLIDELSAEADRLSALVDAS